MLNTWNKLRSWASFEIYSPWPDLTMKLTCWVESLLQTCPPVPYKTLRPFNIRANLASRVMIQMSFPSPALQQNNTLNKLRQFILSHFWKLQPPDPTQQYVKHVKKIGILSHFVDFVTVLLKALRSTYEPTWHPESCSKSFLYSSKINTLNVRMNKVEMLICLETFHPPSFPTHTLNKWRKIASWVIVQFTTPRPYKIKRLAYRESLHVASVFKFTLLDPTKKIVELFNLCPEYVRTCAMILYFQAMAIFDLVLPTSYRWPKDPANICMFTNAFLVWTKIPWKNPKYFIKTLYY